MNTKSRSRRKVWFISGGAAPFAYSICRAIRDRGDVVIAASASQSALERLAAERIVTVKLSSELSYGQIITQIRSLVECFGKIDYIVHYAEFFRGSYQSSYGDTEADLSFRTNTFAYGAMQVTKAICAETTPRWCTIVTPDALSGRSSLNYQLYNTLEGVAQLLVAECRTRGMGVSIINPWLLVPPSSSGFSENTPVPQDFITDRTIRHVSEGGPSGAGIKVL